MHPILFSFKGLTVHTYGLMAGLGFIAAIFTATYCGRKNQIKGEDISDLALYIMISAIIGARLFYVLVEPGFFMANPLEIFKVWNGGLVFYGGFILAVITSIVFVKLRSLDLGKTADSIAPGIAIGHSFGRIGCFFAGCCYGKATDLPFGIVFNNSNSLAPTGVCLHPTQIYSSLSNFFIFLVLIYFMGKKKKDGDVFLLYLFLYGVLRMIIEYFRGDNRGELIFNILSTSQFIGIVAVLTAISLFVLSRRLLLKEKNG